jgi:hypothetical protein
MLNVMKKVRHSGLRAGPTMQSKLCYVCIVNVGVIKLKLIPKRIMQGKRPRLSKNLCNTIVLYHYHYITIKLCTIIIPLHIIKEIIYHVRIYFNSTCFSLSLHIFAWSTYIRESN